MDSSDRRFVKREDFVTRIIAGETIVVPVRGRVGDLDSIYTVNEIGTTIWELIDGKRSIGEIADAIGEAYEVAPEEARRDVEEFIGSLEAEGLIETVESPGD